MQAAPRAEKSNCPQLVSVADVSTAPRARHRWLRSVVPGSMGLACAFDHDGWSPSVSRVNHLAAARRPPGVLSQQLGAGVQLGFEAQGQMPDLGVQRGTGGLASSGLSRISARRALLMARRASKTAGVVGGSPGPGPMELFGPIRRVPPQRGAAVAGPRSGRLARRCGCGPYTSITMRARSCKFAAAGLAFAGMSAISSDLQQCPNAQAPAGKALDPGDASDMSMLHAETDPARSMAGGGLLSSTSRQLSSSGSRRARPGTTAANHGWPRSPARHQFPRLS